MLYSPPPPVIPHYPPLSPTPFFPARLVYHLRRMNRRNILIALAVGGTLWYLVTQTKRVDIGAASISRLKIEGSGVRINIKLPIINRSDFPVPVSGFLGRLLYNGVEIGSVQQTAPVQLAPRAVTIPEFTTVISFIGVATSTPLLGILNTLAKKFLNISLPGIPSDQVLTAGALTQALGALRIQGTLYVGQIGIDINEPLTA